MKHDGGWVRRSSRYLFESQWFNLRQDAVVLPGDEPITYTLVEHPGYAMVVPLLDDGRVVLERVYRYTVQETVLECPSGGLAGQAPEAAARRELEEETGWIAGEMRPLGSFSGATASATSGSTCSSPPACARAAVCAASRPSRSPSSSSPSTMPPTSPSPAASPTARAQLALILARHGLGRKG